MLGPPPWQVGECVDEWTGGPCTHHYMTLGGGPMPNTTVADAEVWCNKNASCAGFTFLTAEANQPTSIYFRDETQIFFMDSEVDGLSQPVGTTTYTSRVHKTRAAPLSPHTNGVQVWVKDVSESDGDGADGADAVPKMALLLVNLGDSELASYTIPFATLPGWFAKGGGSGKPLKVRDAWNHKAYAHAPSDVAGGTDVQFQAVAPHDSVFLVLSW